MTGEKFPYTDEIDFIKFKAILGDVFEISPPSNWGDEAFDYLGYFSRDGKLQFVFNQKNDHAENGFIEARMTIKQNHHCFVNYKKCMIFAIPNTYDGDLVSTINEK